MPEKRRGADGTPSAPRDVLPQERPERLRPTARRPGSHLAALSSGPIQPRYRALLRLAMRPPGRRSLRPESFRTLLSERDVLRARRDLLHHLGRADDGGPGDEVVLGDVAGLRAGPARPDRAAVVDELVHQAA